MRQWCDNCSIFVASSGIEDRILQHLGKWAGRWFVVFVCTIEMSGCGNESEQNLSDTEKSPVLTAVNLGEQNILGSAEYLTITPYRDADRENGARQAQICKACHSLEAGGPNMIGPALHDLFGRRIGAGEGFAYSPAMKEVNFIWTPRALDAWLVQPGAFLPGNRMTFAGVFRESDRNDLIAYLLEATAVAGDEQE